MCRGSCDLCEAQRGRIRGDSLAVDVCRQGMIDGSKPFISITTRLESEQKVSDNVNIGGQRGDDGLGVLMRA